MEFKCERWRVCFVRVHFCEAGMAVFFLCELLNGCQSICVPAAFWVRPNQNFRGECNLQQQTRVEMRRVIVAGNDSTFALSKAGNHQTLTYLSKIDASPYCVSVPAYLHWAKTLTVVSAALRRDMFQQGAGCQLARKIRR